MTDEKRETDTPAGEAHGAVVKALPLGERPHAVNVPAQVRDALDILADVCRNSVEAVIFFGSQLVGTSPDAASAADLIVVVRDYTHFYNDIDSQLPASRHIGIITTLNRILAPNIINLNDPGGMRAGAKCFVVSEQNFRHSMSRAARDYFFRGRLSQRVEIVYARKDSTRRRMQEYLAGARRLTLDWVPLYLPEWFTVGEYCLRMLEVSYAGEIRPESRDRVREVYEAQREFFRLVYGRILDDAAGGGYLVKEGERYRLTTPPTKQRVRFFRNFWRKSKARATLRWLKYMLTFDDWLDYIVHKTERRTGIRVELTQAERRVPFLLLWPKVFKVLRATRAKPAQNEAGATGSSGSRDEK